MNIKKKLKEVILEKAKSKTAMLAMNVQSLQQINIASELATELQLEIFIQFSSKFIHFFDNIIGIENILKKYRTNDKLYFHLDHCTDYNLIQKCIDWGFDSVMFDGSGYDIAENIKRTLEIVILAHNKGVLVEGEVGIVGGVEDDFTNGGSTVFKPSEAIQFYEKTRVDMLALGIGNAHGIYNTTSNVKIELLGDFQSMLNENALLVLHGATGLKDEQIFKAIDCGVVKVNFSTEFKLVYKETINEILNSEFHDEIFYYNKLKNKLRPVLTSIINKINEKCI
jgi:fructose-bisphosphate aldolase class II